MSKSIKKTDIKNFLLKYKSNNSDIIEKRNDIQYYDKSSNNLNYIKFIKPTQSHKSSSHKSSSHKSSSHKS